MAKKNCILIRKKGKVIVDSYKIEIKKSKKSKNTKKSSKR